MEVAWGRADLSQGRPEPPSIGTATRAASLGVFSLTISSSCSDDDALVLWAGGGTWTGQQLGRKQRRPALAACMRAIDELCMIQQPIERAVTVAAMAAGATHETSSLALPLSPSFDSLALHLNRIASCLHFTPPSLPLPCRLFLSLSLPSISALLKPSSPEVGRDAPPPTCRLLIDNTESGGGRPYSPNLQQDTKRLRSGPRPLLRPCLLPRSWSCPVLAFFSP